MTSPSPSPPAASRWDLPPLRWAVLGLILLALLLAGGASLVSPWFAFTSLRSAAAAGDADALAELIDADAVRAGLYPQVDARLPLDPPQATRPAPEPRPRWLPDFVPWPLTAPVEDALRPVTRPVERPLRIRRRIDELTTPRSLAGLTQGEAHVRDWALRRFRVAVRGSAGETVLSFHRTGPFDWRLVNITLPAPGAG